MLKLFDLAGKTAVVTGAGRGLGHGYAVNLARAGAKVACIGREKESLLSTVRDIVKAGGTASAFVCDIADADNREIAVSEIIGTFGGIDILINNAGTEIAEPFEKVTEEHFDKIMSVNIKGTYMMTQTVSKHMKNGGKIINIASLGSYIGLSGSTVYCCSKGAVSQFTKALAVELAGRKIQVNAIAPGYFLTEMTAGFFEDEKHSAWISDRIPLGRIGTEDDLAGTVVFLSSAASDYITGQTVIVDGGWLAS